MSVNSIHTTLLVFLTFILIVTGWENCPHCDTKKGCLSKCSCQMGIRDASWTECKAAAASDGHQCAVYFGRGDRCYYCNECDLFKGQNVTWTDSLFSTDMDSDELVASVCLVVLVGLVVIFLIGFVWYMITSIVVLCKDLMYCCGCLRYVPDQEETADDQPPVAEPKKEK